MISAHSTRGASTTPVYTVIRNAASMRLKDTVHLTIGFCLGIVVTFFSATHLSGPQGLVVTHNQRNNQQDHRHFHSDEANALSHEVLDKEQKLAQAVEFHDQHTHHDDDKEAAELKESVRILCWIMTSPQNLDKKAIHVKQTWARRCNVLLFISSTTNDSFPTVGLNISEGREHLTGKTMQAFRYVYEHHFHEADWFLKADDDTYVIMENMRYFLSNEDTESPIYFGHHFKTIVKQGYFSGGAGYVLSKEAMRRFMKQGNDSKICRQDGGSEDAEIGKCMENLGVKVGNSTDALGRSRFHCFDPETHLHGNYMAWYYEWDANGAKQGIASISDYAITFHYVSPQKMYDLEFYIYHLRPYGIKSGQQDLNTKV